MKKYIYSFFLAAFTGVTTPHVASAKLININFGIDSPTAQLVGGAGVLTWNLLKEDPVSFFPDQDSISGLFDSTGAATAASFRWDNLGYDSITNSPFVVTPCVDCASYEALMKSYIYSDQGETLSMGFSGLVAGTYDMYVYSQGDSTGQILDMSVLSSGGTLHKVTNPSDDTLNTLRVDQNYLLFSGIVVGDDGKIDLSFHGDPVAVEDLGFGVINGIQLTPVPEPSTMLLLGVGSVIFGTGAYRRRFDDNSRIGA